MPRFAAGQFVVNPKKPEWGPGKVVAVRRDIAHVFFRDREGQDALPLKESLLEDAGIASDPLLDHLPPLAESKDGRLRVPNDRLTLAQARAKFLRYFPGGFHDPDFLRSERNYKVEAHERLRRFLAEDARTLLVDATDGGVRAAMWRVFGDAINLLGRQEIAALGEGLSNPDAGKRYIRSLLEFTQAPRDRERFDAHAAAVLGLPAKGPTKTDSWPVATIGPFLAAPSEFIFVKPTITKDAAAALGFDLMYDATPNWPTYERVRTMADVWRERLVDLQPRDYIDIQSFFFITSGLYEKGLAKHTARRSKGDLEVDGSFIEFIEKRVIPHHDANPDWTRLDGGATEKWPGPFGFFRHGGATYRVHEDTRFEPLFIAYHAMKDEGIADPFVTADMQEGVRLDLLPELAERHRSPHRHMYVYLDR